MKMKYVIGMTLASLYLAGAHSAVPKVPSMKATKPSPTVVTGGKSDVISSSVIIQAQSESCKTEDTISLELFKQLMVQEGAQVTVKKNWNYCPDGQNKCGVNFSLNIPAHVQDCMSLQAIPRTDGSHVYMEFKNAYPFSKEGIVLPDGKSFEQLTAAEKYEGCLRKAGILNGDKWDMSKAQIGVTMMTVPKKIDSLPQTTQGFEKAQKDGSVLVYDNKAESKILGLSSLDFARDYPLPSSDIVGVDNPSISGCYQAHSVSGGGLATSKDLELRTRAEAVCQSKSYDDGVAVEKDIGNDFGSLSKETKDVVAQLRKTLREERIKKGKEYLDSLASKANEIMKGKTEEELRNFSEEYMTTLESYKKEVLDPLILELEQLYKMRAEAGKDQKRVRELDEQIRQVGDLVGRYAAGTYKAQGVADKFLEFGISIDATTIYEIYSKSRLYKEVRHVGSPKKKPETVVLEIKKVMDTYSKRAEFADKVYAAKTGAASYSAEYQQAANRYRTSEQRIWSDYKTEEQKYYDYCRMQFWGTVQNPARCKYGIQTYQQRYQQAYNTANHYGNQAMMFEKNYNMFANFEHQARMNAQYAGNGMDPVLYDPYGGDALYNFSFMQNPNVQFVPANMQAPLRQNMLMGPDPYAQGMMLR